MNYPTAAVGTIAAFGLVVTLKDILLLLLADALSGATYSSKGVKAGVKDATERLIAALGK